jgi:catechol 2,3-dioxygenase-like lactoylglutathione lyase family enzyme
MPEPSRSAQGVKFANPQVTLYSADLEASVRFYRDVLGFAETFRIPKEGATEYVELQLSSLRLGIATFDALERHHGLRTGRGPPRFEVDLNTADVDGAYGWALSQGAPSRKAPADFLGFIHNAYVADPDGNHIVFYTRLPVTASAKPAALPTFRSHLYNLYTNDIERSLRFYHELLGFTETFRLPEHGPPSHVEMELGPLNLAVSTVEALKREHGLSGGGGPPRAEVVLSVADVDAAYSWLRSQGTPSLSPPHDFARVLRGAWVGDPDGNPVQMIGQPGRG